ncbi:MAG: hypothetical protein II984_02890 [Clostridia bacterium]|nr:hypothetical protein [Clostridia bacterium]
MKRVKSGCIFQTLIFVQKKEYGLSKEQQLQYNRAELEKYKAELEKNKIRYQITSTEEQNDGSIIICVRKQINDKTDVSEYFN